MLERLESSYEQIKRFTAEASHELRTPLSIIRLQAERLSQQSDMPAAERVEAAAEQLEEVGRLNKLIDDMLLLAKADAGAMRLECKGVDPAAFGEDFSNDAELLAEEQGVRFDLENTIDRIVHFDPAWMRHVLLNLLSNALKFSPSGSLVRLTFSEESGCPVFRMIDEGPGLPEAKLETIFHRFERVDSTGDANVKGNGLGLAICRSIVQRHGGTICARNRRDRSGLIVEVRLPEKEQTK
jgi:signal transduction histidine kinase